MNTRNLKYSSSIVNFAKQISSEAWNRIRFSRSVKGGIRTGEVTLTENLVFAFFLFTMTKRLPLKIFQSTNEKVNGNDLEILLLVNGSVIKFPCQAKIIYKSRRYEALRHKVGPQFQIDLLIKYAKKIGGFPLYIFYNYDDLMTPLLRKMTEGVDEYWGCSVASASELKKRFFLHTSQPPPRFHDLHPSVGLPFYYLFEVMDNAARSKNEGPMLFSDFDVDKLTKYSIEEIIEDPTFIDLTSPEALGYVDHFDKAPFQLTPNIIHEDHNIFNPRFRILVTDENVETRSLQFLD